MSLINFSYYLLPIMLLIIIIYALYKKVNIYDVFVIGAKEGIEASINIFPYLLAMIFAINIFTSSNVLEPILHFLKPFFHLLKMPLEIIPMAIMRPISGSASLAMMNDIFTKYGVDSYLGRVAATIQGSTETTIYILTLYFGCIGIKKIKYALWVGLLADLIGIIASIIIVNIIW